MQAVSQCDNHRAEDWQLGTQHHLPFFGLNGEAPLTFDSSKLTTKNINLLHTWALRSSALGRHVFGKKYRKHLKWQ
jgi:hypothetical protein